MEVVGCKKEAGSCALRPGPGAMLFHGISGDHIQGIMEEMERRSKSESRLSKGLQLNGRESVRGRSVEPRFYSWLDPRKAPRAAR
ncbi:LIM/homeobox protein Lhx9 [Liparis tanakae]|uniref:LIM/homeobox protein Lhx9 n=1 Tax=Liparis tanakae TaxID=230148 RepID=A0A4Z2FB73_9TELE|nr:LIM/homeobox protein Lhx9 [Liparis tanakae]